MSPYYNGRLLFSADTGYNLHMFLQKFIFINFEPAKQYFRKSTTIFSSSFIIKLRKNSIIDKRKPNKENLKIYTKTNIHNKMLLSECSCLCGISTSSSVEFWTLFKRTINKHPRSRCDYEYRMLHITSITPFIFSRYVLCFWIKIYQNKQTKES